VRVVKAGPVKEVRLHVEDGSANNTPLIGINIYKSRA